MKKFFLLLISLAFILSASAQKKIYFCSDYTSTGEPIGASTEWTINSSGGFVYFVYKNGGENIKTSQIIVFIDKMSTSNEYKAYATKFIIPYKHMNWCLFDFKFTEAGQYKVKYLDNDYNELDTQYLTINIEGSSSTTTGTSTTTGGGTSTSTDKIDWTYYDGTKIYFCENVNDSGQPINDSETFNIPYGGGYVQVLVSCPKELKTEQLIVDVYSGNEYKDFVETKYIDINSSYYWTYFKYTFTKSGNFKFLIYAKNWTPIGKGFVTIKYN